jgi:sugar lactone lactonase YvrE
VDAQGDVWVADTWNHRIAHFGADGKWIGAFNDTERGFFGPRAVLVLKDAIYVADTGNKRIVRFDRSGKKLSEWGGNGNAPGQFVEPVGLAADAASNIYVADTGNHRVQVFTPEGKPVRQFPVDGWKDFYTEPYIAVGPDDAVFVTDAASGRISQYDASGSLRRSWKADTDFKQPTGLALDALGRLNVSDRGTNRIFSWMLGALP